jgi:hypothetical protein
MQYSDEGNGITAESLAFFVANRRHLGDIVEISIRFPGFTDPFDPYLMVLRDRAGHEIRLSGCTAGYNGEGPRGSERILRDIGIGDFDAARVLTEPDVYMRVVSAPRPTSSRPEADHQQMFAISNTGDRGGRSR